MNRPLGMNDSEFLQHLMIARRAYFGGVERRIAAGTKKTKKGEVKTAPSATQIESATMERIDRTIEMIKHSLKQ